MYVLWMLTLALSEPPTVYQSVGTHPRATNYELKRRLADSLARAGVTEAQDTAGLPAPWRVIAASVGRMTESPVARAAYDRYGPAVRVARGVRGRTHGEGGASYPPSTAARARGQACVQVFECKYCLDANDYMVLAIVDLIADLVLFTFVSALSTSLRGTSALRAYPIALAVLWVVLEQLEAVDPPLAFMTAWTPYLQAQHFRRLLLAVLAMGPLLLRDHTQLTTKERLVGLQRAVATSIEVSDRLLAGTRRAAAAATAAGVGR